MMNTKTCPHCNETSLLQGELEMEDWAEILLAWRCTDCGKIFWTRKDDEDESI